MKIRIVIASIMLIICGYVMIFIMANFIRSTFGFRYGNYINLLIVLIIAAFYYIIHLTEIRKFRERNLVIFISIAMLLAFFAWFMQPEKVFERAFYLKFDLAKLKYENRYVYLDLFWVSSVICLISGGLFFWNNKNHIYQQIEPNTKKIYQYWFTEILSNMHISAKIQHDPDFNMEILRRNIKTIYTMSLKAESELNLNARVLQIMVTQYIYADFLARDADKNVWVEKVTNREDIDYFPDENFSERLFSCVYSEFMKASKKPNKIIKRKKKNMKLSRNRNWEKTGLKTNKRG